ncbi:integrase arm-type DNA-binding domain-containing protein [Bartonella grahamii]|uniref:integrase arm-type DNA-binding domain-containing protein n=1 Tax=Bartonella grahamii TaxID=33045 RepID=UPI003558E9D8
MFRFDLNKRRRETGLGFCSNVSLKEARFKASVCYDFWDQGIDPIHQKKENLRRARGVFLYEKLPPALFVCL